MSRTDDYLLTREESREDGECDRCGEVLDLTAVLGEECVMVGGRPLCLECYAECEDDLDEEWDEEAHRFIDDVDPDTLSDEDL